jgi:hypothetical protein
MKPQLLSQLLFSVIIVLALGAVSYFEWRKLGFWGFYDHEALAAQEQFAARLENVPKDLPSWEFLREAPTNPQEIKLAGVDKVVSWDFKQRSGDDIITIFLASGPTNQLCIHTPDQCYPGHGSSSEGESLSNHIVTEAGQNLGNFRSQTFSRVINETPVIQEIWWGFTADGKWDGPADPRSDFIRNKALYKLYVMRSTLGDDRTKTNAKASQRQFLNEFLPALNQALKFDQKSKAAGDESPAENSDESQLPANITS